MKLCPKCDQPVAEEITTCPACGATIVAGRKYIDDYRIVDVLHEGHASFLCRAIRERTQELVMIRLFTPQSGVNEDVARRLEQELEELKKLPPEGFVRHYAIRRSSDGLWYRTSEWINTESWGSVLASGRLGSLSRCIDLFHQMASILAVLHEQGHIIPHLILNDIIVVRNDAEALQIKIDYKLSRFFDPKLDRPGPMLKKLLTCHPDIVNQRPLDFQSDIWSLGKIFVELLTADLEAKDFLGKIDELQLPSELDVLLKVMLADDPDIRPRSMVEVAESLARIKAALLEKSVKESGEAEAAPARTLIRLNKMVKLLAAAVVVLVIVGIFAWFHLGQRREDISSTLEKYANRYARSVAFLLTEYWLEADNIRYYANLTEGTAFLVDRDGYMLTGRHVVCPWLEDAAFFAAAEQLRRRNLQPRFGHRIFLWFDGEKAFNRGARMIESPELADVFFLDTAYSTESPARLSIAGVAKPPLQTRQLITSPLRDDFAVLKIDSVPKDLNPLPLDLAMDPRKIPRLTPVIALGFPLGRRTQADTVNVSVTSGHVRRTFENLIQVDASIYGGNSGGPIIDSRGRVIGIVAGVALDWTPGFMPVATPMWDLGMILPIDKAVNLLIELKAGQVKWDGLLDFSAEDTLRKIREAAVDGRWAEAMQMADEGLQRSLQPSLVTAAGMMHYCTGDYAGAKGRFSQALSMDAEDYQARLMLFLIDYITGARGPSPHGQYLLGLDWRSAAEFQSYLAGVLEGRIDEETALKGWYTSDERSWLHYAVSLRRSKHGAPQPPEQLLKEAMLSADLDSWGFFLAHAQLAQFYKQRRASLRTAEQWTAFNAELEAFNQQIGEVRAAKKSLQEQMAPFISRIGGGTLNLEQKLAVLEEIYSLIPENRSILAEMAYSSAATQDWDKSLGYIHSFLNTAARENARRLSIEILEASILKNQGKDAEARQRLENYQRRVRESWFLSISDYLLGKETEPALRKLAGETPEKLLTAFTYMGFWAEASGEGKQALKHYKEALESFLDDWLEYGFARERIKRLRKPSPVNPEK
jgi:S1-C subfamily serine protease/serine/threonine protein kinase